MHSIRTRVAVLFALLLACPPAQGAQAPANVLGRLVSAVDGKPVSGARIVLSGVGMDTSLEFSTDGQGRFARIVLRPGYYQATIECEGFAPVDVLQIDVRPADNVRLNLKMTPLDDAPFKRQIVRYRRPLINTENATLVVRMI